LLQSQLNTSSEFALIASIKQKFPQTKSRLVQAWRKLCQQGPQSLAIVEADTDKKWSRGELDDWAQSLADGLLQDAGRRRVALCVPNSAEWIAFFLAVQYAGGSIIPLDAGTPLEARETLAHTAGADWLYSVEMGLTRLRSRRGKRAEACVKLTSGSSGQPKRNLCRAEHLLADGRNIIRAMKINSADRNLGLIPLGHSYGLGNLVMPFLMQGTMLVLSRAFVPRQIPEWIKQHRITVFPSVPAVYRMLASLPGEGSLAPLRLAISAGAPLPPETARAFWEKFGVKVHNFYGSTETGGICFDREGEESMTGASIGTVLPGVKVRLLSNQRIRVSGAAVSTPSGEFTMPDYGEWSDSRRLRLLGRAGAVANLGGKKVRPAEVEGALRQLPGVTDAVVYLREQAQRHYLAAAVETGSSARKIQTQLAKVLPAWKQPRVLKTLPLLPRNERGKLDPKRIAAWLGD
jgi:acyl-coenzyme A synthetase/AMP-(fatty) acid ligase